MDTLQTLGGCRRYPIRQTHKGMDDDPIGRGTLELAADDDYLWLAAPNDGLRRFHFASGTWARFRDIKGLLHNHVGEYGLAVDEDYVWVGTLRGLSRYDKQKESWTPLTALPTLVDARFGR